MVSKAFSLGRWLVTLNEAKNRARSVIGNVTPIRGMTVSAGS